MVVVINGTNGIVAPGLTSQDSTGTSTLTTSGVATIGGPLTVNDSASITGTLTAASASITGALTAGSASITGALTADSASITGGISAASLALGGTTVTSSATELNKLDGVTVGATEFNYLTGATGNIQPQINAITLTPQVITANTNAVAGNFYYLDSAGITLTLPSSPSVGALVGVSEIAGDTTSIVARNGSNIMSDSANLTLDIAYGNFVLTYTGATVGWAFSG